MNENRLKHSLAVARKMVEITTKKGMTDEDIKNRYGQSDVYNKCLCLVNKIRDK